MNTCRDLAPDERRLLNLLVEQFETIGRLDLERVRIPYDDVARDLDFRDAARGLVEAGRLDQYDGTPYVARDAQGFRVYPVLARERPQRTSRAAPSRLADLLAYLVGRDRTTMRDICAALDVKPGAISATVARVVGMGLLAEDGERTGAYRVVPR